MALTRSMLKGMGLTEEQVSAIIDEHVTVTNGLKDQIKDYKDQVEQYKESADQLPTVKKELEDLKKDIETNDWKGKYTKEHEDFEKYKTDIAGKEALAKVRDAYTKLLMECKVGSKHIDSILRVTDFKDMKVKEDGTLEDADALKEKIGTDWSGFITTEDMKGADVNNPPAGSGDPERGTANRAAQLAAKYHENHYGKLKEN